ncbi:hypothetical protein HF086_017698 [Spodoptera exigua]|uniref:Mitochondrial cardiolipin hydrolase n=1 Tax=Spodoptera exigua TaxID=7107 RepID=A0A922M3B2_SPOEX|nr:hypothetical protein HF086_017698 [Spodoptera exigua]
MDWKNAKLLFVSTATVIVATQIVKKAYKYFFHPRNVQSENPSDDMCDDLLNLKTRDINDVIVFSDDATRHTVRIPPTKEITICESRDLNCYKLLRYINSTRETLDVCMYLITSGEIAEQIIRLGQRHVLVRIVVDSDMAFTPPSQIKKLKEYSFIQVQTTSKSRKTFLMHHKFCIVDGPKAIHRKNMLKAHAEKLNVHAKDIKNPVKIPAKVNVTGFVMSGSLNWSSHAMISNHESVIVTSHPKIVTKFENEFGSLWVENEPVGF